MNGDSAGNDGIVGGGSVISLRLKVIIK